MRKVILAAFLVVCVCAYPSPNKEVDVAFEEIIFRNIPNIRKQLSNKPITISDEEWKDIIDICKPSQPSDGIQDNVNACIDKLFSIVDGFIAQNFDPLPLKDMHAGFNYTLIITYHGELDLTNGKLLGFSTLHRTDDAKFDFNIFNLTATVGVGFGFDQLGFTYDYSAKIMNLGPKGGLEGSVTDLAMNLEVGFDFKNKALTLKDFSITNSGNITFKFTGHAIVDWLLNCLTKLITKLMKGLILEVMEDVVGGAIDALIDAINNYWHKTPLLYDVSEYHKYPIVKFNVA
ncbi:uncharacterized protein LOC662271 [Tribolium castaneum]|uniref:Circadian clock-controlled protein-like Protein n=1 Tax=Tribolium castaneum TaxID=7070 RepID=D6WUX7_TRICA|nr:PREDICTED: uncharacterized protein LOC662271 [Tribolium castaneum]EFA08505.1 hypothetical protein TcasGA2_TC006157 [Tribolium castaneum]|eukprot:XP_976417.1 PREDICTED: uncharacterized protein LOC662271 [Tribolium castaneum]